MRLSHVPAFSSFVAIAVLAACSPAPSTPGPDGGVASAGAIVGVTTDVPIGGAAGLSTLHVKLAVNGTSILDSTITPPAMKLPSEFDFGRLVSGDKLHVEIETRTAGGEFSIQRSATTEAIAGRTLLIPLKLSAACEAVSLGGPAQRCPSSQTCDDSAKCVDDHVDPSKLPAYSADWSKPSSDVCKPKGHGAPRVILGQGQDSFLPLSQDEVVQVEAGPQGGHHIWVAVREQNLTQSGSVTEISGRIPDLGIDVEPLQVIFTFDQDEGGFCKVYGLRFQLDQSHDINTLLGHKIEVTAKITDRDGDTGTGSQTVTLSDNFI